MKILQNSTKYSKLLPKKPEALPHAKQLQTISYERRTTTNSANHGTYSTTY
jgi:hypothetical protein